MVSSQSIPHHCFSVQLTAICSSRRFKMHRVLSPVWREYNDQLSSLLFISITHPIRFHCYAGTQSDVGAFASKYPNVVSEGITAMFIYVSNWFSANVPNRVRWYTWVRLVVRYPVVCQQLVSHITSYPLLISYSRMYRRWSAPNTVSVSCALTASFQPSN